MWIWDDEMRGEILKEFLLKVGGKKVFETIFWRN